MDRPQSLPGFRNAHATEATLTRWILCNGRYSGSLGDFVRQFGRILVDAGIPVWRLFLAVRHLDPTLYGHATVWERATDQVREIPRPHGMERSGYYKDNPVSAIFERGEWVRCRLDDPTGEPEYPVLRDLRDCGGTDYIALPLAFRGARYQAVAFTSDAPSGFAPEHVALLEALLPSLSSTVEVLVSYGQMERVLATYVGTRASEVILSGVIQRGQVQTIRAVIWVSDLRSFTTISEALRPSELITLLDDYFDCLVEPIAKCGGEVLKFMGDSVLAIFPLPPAADQRTVCCAAAQAAREAIEAVDRLNGRWRHLVAEPLSCGIALHIGDVSYGNIGSVDRLDFTAIGPAVNLASRLERVTRNIARRIVVSESFADILGPPAESIGHFRLPGIPEVQHVFSFPHSSPGEAESIREKDL